MPTAGGNSEGPRDLRKANRMQRLRPFQDELPIPDMIHPIPGPNGGHVAIAARAVRVRFHGALPAATAWCYRLDEGTVASRGHGTSYLGPTVEVQRAERMTVEWRNDIPAGATLPYEVIKVPNGDAATVRPVPQNEPGREGALSDAVDPARVQLRGLQAALVTHLHGGRTPADSDGWPDNTALPGQVAHFTYPNDQAATMLWYHDHCMHVTRFNVFAGLAGAWLIRDAEEHRLGLPSGAYEIPLVIQDRNLDVDAAGQFTGALLHKTEIDDGPMEFFGPYTLVNGKIWPKATVEPSLYRLRILNAANARTYRLLLLDERGGPVHGAVWQIGCDQGLMHQKTRIPDDGLIVTPAERVDLLVDFAAFEGQRLYLWNTADAPFGDDPANRPDGAHVADELRALLADPLASADAVDPTNAVNRRPYPQVLRFDVDGEAATPSHQLPADPLWSVPRAPLVVAAATRVRIMALVEASPGPDAGPAAVNMLVFWEYVPVDEQPAPVGVTPVAFMYWHPGKGTFETRQFWKAAERFYDRINWFAHVGSTELWYIVNLSPDSHPIHVHLVDLMVHQRWAFRWNGEGALDPAETSLARVEATEARPIEPNVRGPKDTVRVAPGEMVGLAMTFAPFPGRYMYHCHILEHEDHDMMRPFVVVPGWLAHHAH
jgi:FtsP/CotA-like multicopper oxidase with cupredoxin domain